MKYLFTIYSDETRLAQASPEELQATMARWDAFTREAIDAGVHLGGHGLQPTSTATVVRTAPGGEKILSDGPFAETREQLGGYYLLDCRDLDDALEWGRRIPLIDGAVEVRPVMDYEAAGSTEHSNRAEVEG